MQFMRPVALRVTSTYGFRRHPITGGMKFHGGIDFSNGQTGVEIRASGDGVVTYRAFEAGGLGHTVTITHEPGLKSGYGHMVSPPPVALNQRVRMGQVIGYVGTTGASTGPHLHYWMGRTPNPPGCVDPTPYVINAPSAPTLDPPGPELGGEDPMYKTTDNGVVTYYLKSKGLVKISEPEAYVHAIAGVEIVDLGGGLSALALDTKLRADWAK